MVGPIPSELGQLVALNMLILHNNKLVGCCFCVFDQLHVSLSFKPIKIKKVVQAEPLYFLLFLLYVHLNCAIRANPGYIGKFEEVDVIVAEQKQLDRSEHFALSAFFF